MQYYSAIILLTILSMLVMIVQLLRADTIDDTGKKAFLVGFLLLIAVAAAEWGGIALNNTPERFRLLHAFVKGAEFALAPAIAVLWCRILSGKRLTIAYGLLAVNAVLEFVSVFAGFIFYIDANNVYVRGNFYWIYILVYIAAILMLIAEAVHFCWTYQQSNIPGLAAIMTFLMVGVAIQTFNSGLRTDWITVAFAFTMFYNWFVELTLQTDHLTRLLSRRSYEHRLARINFPTVIIMFDVDDFKSVNDTYGHAAGDEILQKSAEIILKTYGSYGWCYRIGGDEFCVILKKGKFDLPILPAGEPAVPEDERIEGFQQSTPVVQQLNHLFDEAVSAAIEGDSRMPNISLGHFRFENGASVSEAVDRADHLMFENKRRRKSRKA